MKTNNELTGLIQELRKASNRLNSNIFRSVAAELEKPTRRMHVVNLSKLSRYTKENETIIVPGKVLGAGSLSQKLTVAAFAFSQSAKEEINKKGKAVPITELLKESPKGKRIRILK